VIVEADWCIGELIRTLDKEGLLDKTMIILSSDNGPVLNDGYYDEADTRNGIHTPAGPLRGGKYSLFEAGTRVPFITYWQGRIEPAVSDALVSQVDLLSSLASLIGSQVAGTDSQDLIRVFLGEDDQGREELILEASTRTALRKGDWKMIPPYGGRAINKSVNIELGNSGEYQLYQLEEDLGEQQNLAGNNEEKLQEMLDAFKSIRGDELVDTEPLELK
jgi:arylsulfatase A-like enzyme